MLNVKHTIWKIRDLVLTKLGITDRNTVYFEGGLGSQILAYIEYSEKNKSSNKPVFGNLDYFNKIESDFTDDTGLSRWTWKLDQYGIYQNDIIQATKIRRFANKYFKVRAKDAPEHLYNFREEKSQNYQKIFSTNDLSVKRYLLEKFNSHEADFAVIHVRRGDYLKIASKVISAAEITRLIIKIDKLLPHNILVSSDSVLSQSEKALFSKALVRFNLVYIDPLEDFFLVHNLMRHSKILVAANSTFSFSAGLLSNNKCMMFFPTNYLGQGRLRDSKSFIFRQPFEYLVG